MFCRNCGKEVSDTALFCKNCGAKVREAQVETVASTASEKQTAAPEVKPEIVEETKPESKPKKKKTGLVIGIILLILLVAAGAAVYLFLNSDAYKSSKMVASAEKLMDDEEYAEAVELLEEALEMNEEDEDAIDLLKEAYEALAEEYLEKGKNEKAAKILKKLAALNGEDTGEPGTEPETTPEPENTPEPTAEPEPEVTPEPTPEPVVEDTEGKVLNIFSFSEEFMTRMEDHYPEYEKIDYYTGRIGDVIVNWIIVPTYDYDYQGTLDRMLLQQSSLKADEKLDIFLIEPMYALKYVDSMYTMDIAELGITEEDIANQYKYTHEMVTDGYGSIKGLTWQGYPGALIYNREIAKEVWGTDDPAVVQEYVADWDSFMFTAQIMNDYGYDMVSTVYDTYRVYAQNATTPWVVDGRVNIDQNILDWVEDSKYLLDMGAADMHNMWTNEWFDDMYPDGKVFCYFGPDWMVNYSMESYVEGSVAYNGDWAVTEGPQGFYWGGSWICAATGTDNEELIKEIMLTMTADTEVMQELAIRVNEMVNNKAYNESLINSDFTNDILGGQNPMSVYVNNAERIDLSNMTAYDESCNEMFQNAMALYFGGQYSLEEALEMFYKNVLERYPELYR